MLQAIPIPSSYVVLSQILLTEALEASEQDNKKVEGICRSIARVCDNVNLGKTATKLRETAKTGTI
jgi:hypothetical protein